VTLFKGPIPPPNTSRHDREMCDISRVRSQCFLRALFRFGSNEAIVCGICFGDSVTGRDERAPSRSK
jgi:hypothetical protein